jgi:hypothetical protein
MALNYADGILYYKDSNNTIQSLSSGGSGSFNTGTLVAQSVNAQFANFIASGFTATTQVGYAANILGGRAGFIPIQSAAGTTSFIATGTVGYVLQMQVGNTATWVSTSAITAGSGFTGGIVPNSVNITSATSATSTSTGSLVVAGGVGIGGDLYVGGNVYSNGYQLSTATALTVGLVTTGTINTYTGTITNVSSLYFDNDSGFDVRDLGSGKAFIGMNSTFKYWVVNGQPTLVANGLDTVEFKAGNGISILTNTGTNPKAITFSITSATLTATAILVTSTATASSTNSGALQVVGGVGVGGSLYVGGTIFGTISGIATTATNLAGGTAGQVPYQSNTGTTSFFGPGLAGQLLMSSGTNAPLYISTGSLYVGRSETSTYSTYATTASYATTATFAQSFNTGTLVGQSVTATNVAGGAAGYIHIQSGDGQTAFIATGTVGYVLQMQVGNTATWVSTSSLGISAESGGSLTSQYFGSNLGTVTTLNFTTGTTATLVSSVLTISATATGSSSGSSTGQFTPAVYTTATIATAIIDVNNIDQYNITSLAADVTFSVTSTVTPDDGQRLLIRIRSDATPRNLTWTQTANQFRTIGISFPTITSASKLVYIGCVYNAVDGYWDLISSLQQP